MAAFDVTKLFISPTSTIQDAIRCIDTNQRGIALVVDEEYRLIGTVVDGDIRRSVLSGLSADLPVTHLLANKPAPYQQPVSATDMTPKIELLQLMKTRSVRHLPLVDDNQRVVSLFSLDEFVVEPGDSIPIQAVVMAGGVGKRLRPLTDNLPKPMLPVGERPLLEYIIEQLRLSGIRQVNLTTHYLPEKIREHFGDGREFGVELTYISEDRPLGTAGGVGQVQKSDGPILVINGDILTNVNFREMLAYHSDAGAALTVAVRKYEYTVPYGVVETENGYVRRLLEKPSYSFFVNAGIYLLEPRAHQVIPNDEHMDMTELIDLLLENGETVSSFPILEYWVDIGQHADYERVQQDVKNGRFSH